MKTFRYKGYKVKITPDETSGFQWDSEDPAGDFDGCDGYETEESAAKGAKYAIDRDIQRQEVEHGHYK